MLMFGERLQEVKALANCPICKGEGKALWQLYNNVPVIKWKVIGYRPDGNKIKHLLVEDPTSKLQREAWMSLAHHEDTCPCCLLPRTRNLFQQLKLIASHMKRVAENLPIKESDLDDPLDDLFRDGEGLHNANQ